MANLLFSHSYFYRFDPKQWDNHQPYPPLATIQAAALLRSNGHEVALHDTNLSHSAREIGAAIDRHQPNYLILYDDGFNYLTKMCLTVMREAALEMIDYASKYGISVIVNSSDSTDHFEQYLKAGAKAVVLGEGEMGLLQVIEELEKENPDLNTCNGMAFMEEGQPKQTPKRPVIKALDELPLPAWDLINIEAYRNIWKKHHGYFSLNMATTRGCPFKCNWCAKPIYGNRYNSRSPKKVVDEIEMLIQHYGVDHFWMCDDIFGLQPGWVTKFEQEVDQRKLKFEYKIQSRVDLLLQEDNIQALSRSGLKEVWVGAESGSQKILDAMDKGTAVEQIYEATSLLKKNGVRVCFFIQFGYLGETKTDIDATLKMVLDLMPDDIGVSVSYPLPGTTFYEKVKNDLSAKANWENSDDLDLMFNNTYSAAFYKKLHRYLHKKYRQKQGQLRLLQLLNNPKSISKKTLRTTLLSTFYYTPALLFAKRALKKLEQ
jgi:anaerobic magnesium-protoporphyrin IX monomethyl ester cyclase